MYKEFTQQALEKLETESKVRPNENKAKAIYSSVISALKQFVIQDGEFAQAIVQSDKTVSDCCTEIAKGIGTAISDLEVYKKATVFYFPGADITFEMRIKLCSEDELTKTEKVINLRDFL